MKWIREEHAEEMKCPYNGLPCTVCQCMAWENMGDWKIDNGEEPTFEDNAHGRCRMIP